MKHILRILTIITITITLSSNTIYPHICDNTNDTKEFNKEKRYTLTTSIQHF